MLISDTYLGGYYYLKTNLHFITKTLQIQCNIICESSKKKLNFNAFHPIIKHLISYNCHIIETQLYVTSKWRSKKLPILFWCLCNKARELLGNIRHT
jgi:hypothetical protein